MNKTTGYRCVHCCAPAGQAHNPKCKELSEPTKEVSPSSIGGLPPLPYWVFMDNLGGLVPSAVRTSVREYGEACIAADRAARIVNSSISDDMGFPEVLSAFVRDVKAGKPFGSGSMALTRYIDRWASSRATQVEAARYRWLRDKSEPGICAFYLSVGKAFDGVKFNQVTVDEAIDAQIAADSVAAEAPEQANATVIDQQASLHPARQSNLEAAIDRLNTEMQDFDQKGSS